MAAREASGEKRGDLIDTLIYLKKTNATLGEGSNISESHFLLLFKIWFTFQVNFFVSSVIEGLRPKYISTSQKKIRNVWKAICFFFFGVFYYFSYIFALMAEVLNL